MEAYKCAFCSQTFASQKDQYGHRKVLNYDLWKVEQQTGLTRMPPGEIPDPKFGSSRRISTGNVSRRCEQGADLYAAGLRLWKGVWYSGMTPNQKRLASDYFDLMKENPDLEGEVVPDVASSG